MIIDHTLPEYKRLRDIIGASRYNGAYYYSQEIVRNIIPNVQTDRNWVTIDIPDVTIDHAIVFAHNNINLKKYKRWEGHDAILVCGFPETAKRLSGVAKTIYLPLSVDVEYISQFKRPKTKEACYVGRIGKCNGSVPRGIPHLSGIPRPELLARMAEFRRVYATDRCAIEAKVLDCKVLSYGYNYGVKHDTDFWQVIDNRDAALMLQEKLDEIDGGTR